MTAPPPYPQGPYMMTPPPMRPRTGTGTKILAIIVISVIILGCVGCALVFYLGPIMYPEMYIGKGTQSYQGVPNASILMYNLNKEGFIPEIETVSTGTMIRFTPSCGATGSAEANRSQAIMGMSHITWDPSNNTTEVQFATNRYVNSEFVSHNISSTLKCVMEKTKAIFTTILGLKILKDDIRKQKYVMPGFETGLVISVMVVISLLWRRKRKCQKK